MLALLPELFVVCMLFKLRQGSSTAAERALQHVKKQKYRWPVFERDNSTISVVLIYIFCPIHYSRYLKCSTDRVHAGPGARSKAQVFGRSPAEIMGSNPTGGMDVCLL